MVFMVVTIKIYSVQLNYRNNPLSCQYIAIKYFRLFCVVPMIVAIVFYVPGMETIPIIVNTYDLPIKANNFSRLSPPSHLGQQIRILLSPCFNRLNFFKKTFFFSLLDN